MIRLRPPHRRLYRRRASRVRRHAINFFGDLDYKLSHTALSTDNTFQASTLDIFASQTEGKFTFVGEIVIEAFGSNEFGVDVDRLEVTYKARPWLRFRAGRIRSAFVTTAMPTRTASSS